MRVKDASESSAGDFMKNMSRNEARIAERPCPGCGAKSGRGRGRKNGFEMNLCQRCGTLYASRIPDAESAEDYDSYYEAENLSVPEFINRRLDEIVAGFAAYRKHGRLLDVGCGAGSVLEAAARAGWEPTGTDISRTAVEHIRGEGLTRSAESWPTPATPTDTSTWWWRARSWSTSRTRKQWCEKSLASCAPAACCGRRRRTGAASPRGPSA